MNGGIVESGNRGIGESENGGIGETENEERGTGNAGESLKRGVLKSGRP